MKNNLYILYYGPSHEKEVSESSKDYYVNLYQDHSPTLIKWIDVDEFEIEANNINTKNLLQILSKNNGLVIIASHGEYAEDGYIQQIFEQADIPFTGASSKTSKLCINKSETNNLVKEIVKIPKSYTFEINNYSIGKRMSTTGNQFPIVLKPNCMGSSVYTYLIKTETELIEKIEELKKVELKDTEFIIQEYIKGIEYSVGVMLSSDGIPNIISITEIKPADEFFTYNAKYNDAKTVEVTPAELTTEMQNLFEQKSIEIFKKIDPTNFYGRLDFIVKGTDIYFLELNTLPGFSKTSIVPQQLSVTNKIGEFKENLLKFVVKN